MSLAGGAKYYIFMNFYGGLNLAYSSLSGNYGYEGGELDTSTTIAPFTSSIIHADIYLGTKWTIKKKFFVSADWIGYGLSLSNSVQSEGDEEYNSNIEFISGSTVDDRLSSEPQAQLQPYYLMISAGVLL